MSENHYSHVPLPIYTHLGNDTNKQRNDFGGLPNTVNQQWSMGQTNEFGNREAYMETQLAEENYNSCEVDSNANQNDLIDDDPYPPPGLRRLVTGQTVSFDDGLSSPPFDRIIPGEGNTFNNFPPSTRMPKSTVDSYPENVAITERIVSGSTTKEYNAIPHQPFVSQPPKKENMNAFNNNMFPSIPLMKKDGISTANQNSYYSTDNTAFNPTTPDFFDSFLRDGSTAYDDNTIKSNQYPKKITNLPGGHQNHESDRKEHFQPDKSVNVSKSQNDFSNENINSPFPINFQSRISHIQQDKVLKSLENNQHPGVEKSFDIYPSNRRASVENFTHEQLPYPVKYDNNHVPKPVAQNHDISFQNYEYNVKEDDVKPFNQSEHYVAKVEQENSTEDAFVNRDVKKKDSFHDNNFTEQRKLENIPIDALSMLDINKESNLKSPYRKNSIIVNEDRDDLDGVSSERGTVPGAQSTPNDSQVNRPFPNNNNSSYNTPNVFKTIEDDDEREDNLRGSDSDEKPLGRRMVLGYNSNTIPGPRSNVRKAAADSKAKQSSFDYKNKMEPLERRMVVGEGGNIQNRNKESSSSRYNRDRKKQLYDRRDHHKIESDDEDYEEFGDRTYDNSPDRESRSYHDKYYRSSPPHRSDKRSFRRNRDSSFTQSQDESYYDDDDDDYDSFRNPRRYHDRRYPREPVYKQYNHESTYRDERYRDRREYCSRYEEDPYYKYERNSRPTSRSGSEYRRDLHTYENPRSYNKPPYYDYLDHRFHAYYTGEQIRDADYWSKIREIQPQKYMEWFKRKFPQEYAEWYSRYVSSKMTLPGNTYQADRRGSGHSGQSSVNDIVSVNEEKVMDVNREQSMFKPVESKLNATEEIRHTPLEFTVPHIKGKFSSLNQLLIINPNSPRDGQLADIDLGYVLPPVHDPDYIELAKFSGPCVIGETHFNTVSNYLKDLANSTSHPSEKLLYQLIDLIIKLRGVTDGIAISELLTDNYSKSEIYNTVTPKEETKLVNNHQSMSETELIENFYHLYFQGNRNEALEFALNNQLWGQAFIAGLTMGPKYHSRVLAEFFSIPINNPLKTAYQFYSKQIPQAAVNCSDEKWSDWRIHLSVMLSYPTPDAEFNKQAIITLGDSLSHKDIFASHFCYLAAQADFDAPTKPSTKYTLLTLRNSVDNFDVYPPARAILLTQIYEFAKRLQKKEFTIDTLLPYKLLLAVRLISYKNFSIASQYLESIASDIIQNANKYDQQQILDVIELSEKIKYSDVKMLNADFFNEKQWLIDLREIAKSNFGNDSLSSSQWHDQPSCVDPQLQYSNNYSFSQNPIVQQPYNNQPQLYTPNEILQPPFSSQPPSLSQPISLPANLSSSINQQHNERRPSQPWESNLNSQDQLNSYVQQDQYGDINLKSNEGLETNDNYAHQHNQYDQIGAIESHKNPWDPPQQTVSLSSHSSSNYFDAENNKKPTLQNTSHNHKEDNQSAKDGDRNMAKEKKNDNNNKGGWLGGILNKFAKRSPNEMKLPDDTNKSIVWDKDKGQWVDINGDNDDTNNVVKPPPSISEMKNFQPQVTPNMMSRPGEMPLGANSNLSTDLNKPPVQSGNMYKLSRGKGMKANYVNVLSQSTTPPATNIPPPSSGMDMYSNTSIPSNVKLFAPTSDGSSNMMSGDVSSNSKLLENPQTRNPNPDMPMYYVPPQYNP